MKLMTLALSLALTLASTAQAHTVTKPIKVTGSAAILLFDIVGKYGNSDAGMGHVYANADKVLCTKQIDEANYQNDAIRCAIQYDGATKLISTKNEVEYNDALNLRRVLLEIAKKEVKISNTEKRIRLIKIDCSGTSSGHEWDDLDLDTTPECTVSL